VRNFCVHTHGIDHAAKTNTWSCWLDEDRDARTPGCPAALLPRVIEKLAHEVAQWKGSKWGIFFPNLLGSRWDGKAKQHCKEQMMPQQQEVTGKPAPAAPVPATTTTMTTTTTTTKTKKKMMMMMKKKEKKKMMMMKKKKEKKKKKKKRKKQKVVFE